MPPSRVFLSPPDVSDVERNALLAAFDSGWIAPVGPELAAFETDISKAIGVQHVVALSSGTAALHLALKELGIGMGDRVYCSTLTFVASANAIRYCGAEPVFIDSDAKSWCMDPNLLADQLARDAERGQLPKAVEVVDIYGQCADYQTISNLCQRYEIPLIEDASEALGATHEMGAAGSFGEAAVLSFNGNKMITTSGGGAFLTNNADLAERVRFLSTQAREPVREYLHREVGYNYRLSNVLAALGRAQLGRLEGFIARRREIFERYQAELSILPGVGFMPEAEWGRSNRWLTCVTLEKDAPCGRDQIIDALEAENIEARPVWRPMHQQPAFSGSQAVLNGVSDGLFAQGLCLPSGSSLNDDDQSRVIDVVQSCFMPA
ncbi:MAG: aminotransferase class I/II-fold pyridoxal phosphate-dependent enzyme [Verrucomicrobiota bacterium]